MSRNPFLWLFGIMGVLFLLIGGFFFFIMETKREIAVSPTVKVTSPCIGAFDDDAKDPRFLYKTSVRNLLAAVVGFETVIVPIWVVLDGTQCPYALNPNYKAPTP